MFSIVVLLASLITSGHVLMWCPGALSPGGGAGARLGGSVVYMVSSRCQEAAFAVFVSLMNHVFHFIG